MELSNGQQFKQDTNGTLQIIDRKPLKLHSPNGGEPLIFFMNSNDKNAHLVALEIIETIKISISLFTELNAVVQSYYKLDEIDIYNYSEIRSLCKKFNKAALTFSQLRKESINNGEKLPAPELLSKDLLRQIITRSYNRAVDNEKALNKHYEAFSSQTYGETSYDRMQMIIEELQPKEADVFVDLGSGVGQLVVHMAGGSHVNKAIGIEIAQLPARFASKLEYEFKKWLNWFGKKYCNFQLDHGDFLDSKYRELITQEATIIFINNYAFQSDLETRIKRELLSELKDGTRIISTKPYVPLNKGAITDRQLNDISVIIDIHELKQCPNPCSWTSAYVPYYMHLERYFMNLRNPALRARSNDGTRRSSTPSSKTSTSHESRESSVGIKETKNGYAKTENSNSEEIGYGPTTRRKWHDYVSELEQQKRKKSSNDNEDNKTNSITTKSTEPFLTQQNSPNSIRTTNTYSCELLNQNSVSPFEYETANSPIRKKVKRSFVKKEKLSLRGRPRKSESHSNHKNPRLSNDAKEGIELLHQMTKAVTSGNNADPTLILADLTNQRNNNLNLEKGKTNINLFPFPNISSEIVPTICSSNQINNKQGLLSSKSKYPNLDKFLNRNNYVYCLKLRSCKYFKEIFD